MNDDELKKLWQQQPLREPDLSAAQVLSAMQNKTSQFRRSVKARDVRELWACAVVIIVFGIYFINERTPIVRLGWSIVIAATIFIAWKLVHARRTTPPAAPDATIVESLRAELKSVRTQSHLLGSVFWWYLLPPGIGLLIATWGMPVHLHAKIPATLVYFAVFAFIYWLNQRARSSGLLPMEAQLESLLRSAETGQPLDGTHVANLRPTILSLTLPAGVKPTEFNIDFWQIALYAEIGFVGMWFFRTLDRTSNTAPIGEALVQAFNWHHLVWIAPFFLGGLLLSWLLKKITDRAVGISPLGVHLCKGQILFPWDEIKAVRPFRFLNIRSLWLIKESGEKTIMPWTGLERHSDLKAAVEASAPSNHPIRQYISLLRQT